MGGVALVERSGSMATSYRGRCGCCDAADEAASATASDAGVTHCPGPVHPCSHCPHPEPARNTEDAAEAVWCACPGLAQAVPTVGAASASAGVTATARVAIASSAATTVRRLVSIPVL